MTAVLDTLPAAVADVLARGDQAMAMQDQVRRVGGCEHPIRLAGRADLIDVATGQIRTTWNSADLPDGTVLVACGNRRASRCQPCSRLYQGDAFQLVVAGLRGGKGVPDTITAHPAVFVTLTAPSFGPVHTTHTSRHGRSAACQPRGSGAVCEHGVAAGCWTRHEVGDPQLGQPICPDCFDYEAAVLWNAHASELWRRTRIDVYRQLARLTGTTERQLRGQVTVQYVKVAEFQRRGLLHFHLAVRLDAAPTPDPKDEEEGHGYAPPPERFTTDLLTAAIQAAAAHVTAPYPQPVHGVDAYASTQPALFPEVGARRLDLPDLDLTDRPGLQAARWGDQLHITPILPDDTAAEVTGLERGQVAGYLGKYATKHTEALGGLDRRVTLADLPMLLVNPHIRRLVATALLLAVHYPPPDDDRLAAWADKLGCTDPPTPADLDDAVHLALTGHAPPRQQGLGDRLNRWAHQLGYGGHWLTKSRAWSTTFTALRAARRTWQQQRNPDALAHDDDQVHVAAWQVAGTSYRTAGDTWLAELARNRATAAREHERDTRAERRLAEALAA